MLLDMEEIEAVSLIVKGFFLVLRKVGDFHILQIG